MILEYLNKIMGDLLQKVMKKITEKAEGTIDHMQGMAKNFV